MEDYAPFNSATTAAIMISTAAGLAQGYCDSQGISLNQGNLEEILSFGPMFASAALGITSGSLNECIDRNSVNLGELLQDATLGAVKGGIALTIISGLSTLVGYGTGYLAGKVFS